MRKKRHSLGRGQGINLGLRREREDIRERGFGTGGEEKKGKGLRAHPEEKRCSLLNADF